MSRFVFTISRFVAELAFAAGPVADAARVGLLRDRLRARPGRTAAADGRGGEPGRRIEGRVDRLERDPA